MADSWKVKFKCWTLYPIVALHHFYFYYDANISVVCLAHVDAGLTNVKSFRGWHPILESKPGIGPGDNDTTNETVKQMPVAKVVCQDMDACSYTHASTSGKNKTDVGSNTIVNEAKVRAQLHKCQRERQAIANQWYSPRCFCWHKRMVTTGWQLRVLAAVLLLA